MVAEHCPSDSTIRNVQKAVIEFYKEKHRRYPWRRTKDPFKILVAEILIKLIGADKAKPVYQEIIRKYGNPMLLSNIRVDELREIIRPLGLINRAKLLVDLSTDIVERFDGEVPKTYSELITLKGVGQYTANAVLCLAHGQKAPMIDESVKRIFTRCFNFKSTKSACLDKDLWVSVEKFLPNKQTKEFNLGLIDIGAFFCKPQKSLCEECPLKFIIITH